MSAVTTKRLTYLTIATKPRDGKQSVDMKISSQLILDRFAIGFSVLCAIHCLAVPVLLLMFPSVLTTLHLDSHVFHELLIWAVIPTSFVAIFLGCKRHKDKLVLALAGIGIAALTASALYGHDALGHTGEKFATLSAVSILAFAHWRNYALCRKSSCNH
jgi:hypothetical protein